MLPIMPLRGGYRVQGIGSRKKDKREIEYRFAMKRFHYLED
jgi:hypothetical protein